MAGLSATAYSTGRERRPVRILALAVMGTLSGMQSYEAIAEWVADVPKDLLRRLRCWCHRAPSEPTFRRVLQSVDADEIDANRDRWLATWTDIVVR